MHPHTAITFLFWEEPPSANPALARLRFEELLAAPPKSPAALGLIREEGDAPLLSAGTKSSKVAALETRPLERICRFPWLSPGKRAECLVRIERRNVGRGGGASVGQ